MISFFAITTLLFLLPWRLNRMRQNIRRVEGGRSPARIHFTA
jgi:hypothetical protein